MFIQQDCTLAYELTQVKIVFCVWKAAGTYEARTSLESFSPAHHPLGFLHTHGWAHICFT